MSPKKKLLVIISLFVGISAIAVGLVLLTKHFDTSSNSPSQPGVVEQNSYIDPATGDTVLSPTGKAVEPASGYDGVLILGLSKLLDIGVSSVQVESIKSDLNIFAKNNRVGESNITEVSLVSDSLSQVVDQSTGLKKIKGIISVNREKSSYNIEFLYYGVADMETDIYNSVNNSLIYRTEAKD